MRISWEHLKNAIASMDVNKQKYLVLIDDAGNILQANARMQKELNLKNPKQVKSNFFDLIHPVHFESFSNALQYSMNDKNPYPMNFFLKNGRYHPMKWQVSSLEHKDKNVKAFICSGAIADVDPAFVKNVSPKNIAEDAIHREFVKNTPNLLWVLDEKANLVFANQVLLSYFRLDETDLNKKITELVPLVVSDSLYNKHLKVFQTGLPLEFTEEGRSANGEKVIFRIKLFLADSTPGKKLVGGIASDQTERNKIEQKLEAVNERLVHLSRITSDAIWEWNMKTGEITRNENLIELTGYLPEDHKGLSWWLSRVHPEDIDQLNETLKEVTDKSLQSWESEYRFRCADGEYKNILDRGFVIYEKGMPVKMIGSLNDVTSEKLMETLLIEEKLRQYKNISEAAMRVQEQERSRLGLEMHDNVNQILSTIRMFVGMLTPASKEEKEIKEKTVEYTMLAIEEIRKLSREMVTPQLEGGAMSENIRNVIADIELATEIKIKFTHDAEVELLSPGKKLTLFRIVQEQLKNVLKYSKATQIEILMQCSNNKVQLVIKDNGIGFDVMKTNYGVGLSGIRDRVKFYNGKTEIESSPGNGCQLEVYIPINEI